MPRGGKRAGTPGKAYGNRSDLNQAQARQYTGQSYGAASKQAEATNVVPISPPQAPGAPPNAPQPSGAPMVPPGSMGAFNRPTERPGEPITTGMDMGPGAGSEAMTMGPSNDAVSLQLRALYMKFPSADLASLLDELE